MSAAPTNRLPRNPVGRGAAQADFRNALSRGRPAHAWLLQGPRGGGKATFAFWAARLLLGGEAAADDPDASVNAPILSRGHPDFHLLAAEGGYVGKSADIPVAAVRELNGKLQMTAARSGWRVVIIDSVCALTPSAANALLKVVEEPPRQTLFLLPCHRPGRIPATLISRCRRLRMPAPRFEDFQTILLQAAPDANAKDFSALYQISAGSPGLALNLLDAGGLLLYRELVAILQTLGAASGERGGIGLPAHAFAAKLDDKENVAWPLFCILLEGIVQRALARRAGESVDQGGLGQLAAAETKPFEACPSHRLLALLDWMSERLPAVERAHLSAPQAAVVAFSAVAKTLHRPTVAATH